MKATLTFDLPEDRNEHIAALKGVDSILALDDLDNVLRDFTKYDGGELAIFRNDEGKECKGCYDTVMKVREILREIRDVREIPELE